MRAWYGKGRHWFVVAASQGPTMAWAWYGYEERWEPLGYEFADWTEADFACAIEESLVPPGLLVELARTIDDMASARVLRAHGVRPPGADAEPPTRTLH